jgi:hypothetical protein
VLVGVLVLQRCSDLSSVLAAMVEREMVVPEAES